MRPTATVATQRTAACGSGGGAPASCTGRDRPQATPVSPGGADHSAGPCIHPMDIPAQVWDSQLTVARTAGGTSPRARHATRGDKSRGCTCKPSGRS